MTIRSACSRLRTVLLGFVCLAAFTNRDGRADAYLVKDGKPLAEIVIAEEPPRTTRLAAAELQRSLEKISGARLPIATRPGPEVPVHVYVGRSRFTDALGISDEGLRYGAYRIATGDDWMVLIGDDTDFTPREPWARHNGDRVSGKLQQAWEQITGEPLGVPNGGMYKNRTRLPGDLGRPDDVETPKSETLELWAYDERGSFNAVCGFLRRLGMRWYLPGELGEVVPQSSSIPLPQLDETVRPDFEVRQFNVRFGTADDDVMLWAMRLGIRNPYGLMIAHGMHTMTQTETVLREHPDWFALYGGRRDTESDKRLNHLCYSNPGLFAATVRWARAQFDVYDFQSVSIMPPDAYISICQCPLCEGQDVPEMGARGKLSNHVWDFVNRVARDVRKTHPEKKIVCCAYGANTLPPTNLDKLEPNVQVVIVGGRRPRDSRPEQREAIRQLRDGWLAKTDNPLMIFENYPFTARGFYLPAYVARTIGQSINATKDISRGEDIWLSFPRYVDADGLGFDHFQVYFTARMYWGGQDQDINALLDEYCRLFYGPAGAQMKAFFHYCENNWQAMDDEKEAVDEALALFAAAQRQVDPQSIYARRLALIDEFLEALRSKSALLAQKRGPVPRLRTVWDPKEPIVIDGRLDDQYWRDCPTASTGRLRELQTGRQPVFGTTIQAGWDHGSLYFAIRCEDDPDDELNIATTRSEDPAIWYGDVVEILLDTDSHSYYQIAVNPAGSRIDLDRGVEKPAWYGWDSQAEVATEVSEDGWTVEIRIPVTDDTNDPLNQVIGRKPSQSLPWHFNICRQRIRTNGSEYSAFSPTGTAGFHELLKFAWFYDGRSHQFEADPTVTDYLIASEAAESLRREGKTSSALEAFVALTQLPEVTDFQISDALQRAAECARELEDLQRARELADRIPIPAVASTVRMENLAARREWDVLVDAFASEPIEGWPFWQIGAGAFVRGRAFSATGRGEQAEADLELARKFTPDSRTRLAILKTLALNRERVLKDSDAALDAWQAIVASRTNTGSADYYSGIQGAARILTQRKQFEDALRVLERVDIDSLHGYWRHAMLLARGETLGAAGRVREARTAYRAVLQDASANPRQRQTAQQALTHLDKPE